ncbi:FAD-binding oxidoreductase [Parasphingorhabdus pacifica]
MTTRTSGSAPETLLAAAGPDRVRDATPADAIGETHPRWVVSTDNTEQTSAAVRAAAEHDLTIVPTGSGTKLGWGGTPRSADVLLDLSHADGIIEHAAGDLVVHARAGTTIAEIQRVVGSAGQQLAIDPMLRSATVGGVVATATAGPTRHLYGSVRDLLIGITVVRADGTTTTSGGKVVKNVAGYDLGKLYTGSYGTLGVITEAIFRLHPLAAEQRWITRPGCTPDQAAQAVDTIRHSQAMPTAIEIDQPRPDSPITVCAQLEGRPRTTRERAQDLADALDGQPEVLTTPPDWWSSYPFDPTDGIGLRIGTTPAGLAELATTIRDTAEQHRLPLAVRGAAGLCVLHAGLPGSTDPEAAAELITELREKSGYVAMLTGPPRLRELIDPWGPTPAGTLELMRRTKDQFDPDHRLAPGRLTGGI